LFRATDGSMRERNSSRRKKSSPDNTTGLKDLFDGRRQLVVYHFMFDPAWDKGCPGCTSLRELHRRSRHAP
jgi:predicted dithiol-disulfide oxidoreductase (DUF899 family)